MLSYRPLGSPNVVWMPSLRQPSKYDIFSVYLEVLCLFRSGQWSRSHTRWLIAAEVAMGCTPTNQWPVDPKPPERAVHWFPWADYSTDTRVIIAVARQSAPVIGATLSPCKIVIVEICISKLKIMSPFTKENSLEMSRTNYGMIYMYIRYPTPHLLLLTQSFLITPLWTIILKLPEF